MRQRDHEGYIIPTAAEMREAAGAAMDPGDLAAVRAAPAPEPRGRLTGITAAHNVLRRRHCVPDLAWDSALAGEARAYAERLRDEQGCRIQHDADSGSGENLSWLSPAGWESAPNIVQGWYDEDRLYDWDDPRFSRETGHFTQIVSSNSTRVGCAVATCAAGQSHTGKASEVWVCRYDPPGNILGEMDQHVRPRCDK